MTQKPRTPQSVYPEPQERSGMAARKPTVFDVPVFTLSLLLFLPVALAMILPSLYIDSNLAMTGGPGLNTVLLSGGIALITITSIILLTYAIRIIARNCPHPYFVQALYFLIIAPISLLLISHFPLSFHDISPTYYVYIQSGLIYVMTLGLALLARGLSRL